VESSGVSPEASATLAAALSAPESATDAAPAVTMQADLASQSDATGAPTPGPIVGPPVGPVPTAPTAPATPAAAPPPPSTPVPGPPATQIAMRIAPLRLEADGVHRLTVNLHPVDLGPVQVVAEIRNGTVNVQLSGATDAGTDALRNAMDELRRELEQSGFGNTTVDLRQGSGQQEQARQQFAFLEGGRAAQGSTPANTDPAPAAPGAPSTEDGRLDIKA
jgi:flagellar hook-length control protein FliK